MPQDEAIRVAAPAGAIYFRMDEADVQRILRFDQTMIGSDGLPHDAAPASAPVGHFPRVLGHYGRVLGLFSLEEGGGQDDRPDRPQLRPPRPRRPAGRRFADLTLFDARRWTRAATYAEPIPPARGIDTVIVNGHRLREGRASGARPGRVLSRRG